jgi:hypothetical protein
MTNTTLELPDLVFSRRVWGAVSTVWFNYTIGFDDAQIAHCS